MIGKRSVAIETAANSFAMITTSSHLRRFWLGLLLMVRYGFWRKGAYALVGDQALFPDFVGKTMVIHAGWDDLFGYDFIAGNAETDTFLRRFHERHCRH